MWDNRLWFWAGISRTDVRQIAINGFPDEGDVTTIAARGDAQLDAATRFSFLYHRAEKQKTGRGAARIGRRKPHGIRAVRRTSQRRRRRAVFAPVAVSIGEIRVRGCRFRPHTAERAGRSGVSRPRHGVWHGGYCVFKERSSAVPDADRRELGARPSRSEIRPPSSADDIVRHGWLAWRWHANNDQRRAPRSPDRRGISPISRAGRRSRAATGTVGVYAGDVMTFDRWTIDAGVRVDWQRGRNEPSSAPANGLAPAILPALEYSGGPVSHVGRFVSATGRHLPGHEQHHRPWQLCAVRQPDGIADRDRRQSGGHGHYPVHLPGPQSRSPRAGGGASWSDRLCDERESRQSGGRVFAQPGRSEPALTNHSTCSSVGSNAKSCRISRWA